MGEFTAERRYLPGTLVVETTFTTDAGVVRLRDCMVFAEGQREHDLGLDAPHEVLRLLEGDSGQVALAMELAPRGEYGLVSRCSARRATADVPSAAPTGSGFAPAFRWRSPIRR